MPRPCGKPVKDMRKTKGKTYGSLSTVLYTCKADGHGSSAQLSLLHSLSLVLPNNYPQLFFAHRLWLNTTFTQFPQDL